MPSCTRPVALLVCLMAAFLLINVAHAQTNSIPTLFDMLVRSDQLQRQHQRQQPQVIPGISPTASNTMQPPFFAYSQPPWLFYYYMLENLF